MNNVIALTGESGIGKDAIYEALASKLNSFGYGCINVKYSLRMKNALQIMFSLTHDQVHGSEKHTPIPHLGNKTPVELLQMLGTDFAQEMVDQDVWSHFIEKEMETNDDKVIRVITDLRFNRQAERLRDKGVPIFHVTDLPLSRSLLSIEERLTPTFDNESHESERLINKEVGDWSLRNDKNRGKSELAACAEAICKVISLPDQKKTLQQEIVDWADSVFPDRTITNALQKLVMEEIPEYLTSQNDKLELADIAMLVKDIIYLAGYDEDEIIREKLEINKNRQWKIDSVTGLMCHIKEEEMSDKIPDNPTHTTGESEQTGVNKEEENLDLCPFCYKGKKDDSCPHYHSNGEPTK